MKWLSALSVAVLGLVPTFGFASAQVGAAPVATAMPTAAEAQMAAILVRAREWVHRLQVGDIDTAQLTDDMAATLTPRAVASIAAEFGPLGDPSAFELLAAHEYTGNTLCVYKVAFKSAKVLFIFAVEDASGKVSALQLTPSE